jgi:hypothetical protein
MQLKAPSGGMITQIDTNGVVAVSANGIPTGIKHWNKTAWRSLICCLDNGVNDDILTERSY